jgi:hypothetical protein
VLRLPQGPSLATGLFCPGRSSLNRPHPPHSRAHRDFTARRLVRDAFAVRERLGDPRVVPSFHCTFLPDMPPSPTPGSPTSTRPELRCRHWPSPNDHRLGTPITPAIRSTRAVDFVASPVRFRYSLPGCLPPCTDQTGILPQPPGTFTSRLSTERFPSPLLDITTTATGLLCWRDSHTLEWQLASLHGHSQPIRFSAASHDVRSASKADIGFQRNIRRDGPCVDVYGPRPIATG